MHLNITSLNSGSNGNCYYIGNDDEAVLVDAGISCRETERRMANLELSMQKVKAIFISHEHSDHIRGVEVLSRKYQLPVYITPDTLRYSRLNISSHLAQPFLGYQPVQVGNLSVTGFPKFHDASDPHSFVVSCNNINIGVFTDIGSPCEHVIQHFSQCHAAFLESNYDDDMLDRGYYPMHLKRRIKGDKGHLSNRQALDLFLAYKPEFMSYVFLSHLSKNNNCPILVKELFTVNADNTEVIVASRYEESAIYQVTGSATLQPMPFVKPTIAPVLPKKKVVKKVKDTSQLSLF